MRELTRKRGLVTGAAGFPGSHLCERLLADRHEVLCIENCLAGTKGNMPASLANHHFELLRHDVTLPLYVEVDEIYHLACPASPIHCQPDISLAREAPEWEPRVKLQEGLVQTIAFFEDLLKNQARL